MRRGFRWDRPLRPHRKAAEAAERDRILPMRPRCRSTGHLGSARRSRKRKPNRGKNRKKKKVSVNSELKNYWIIF